MNTVPNQCDGARRLAVDKVEGTLVVETPEHLERTRGPSWVAPREPRVRCGSIDIAPAGAVSMFFNRAFGVPGRDDVDVMTRFDQSLGERTRVVLHTPDTVARDGDNADSHGGRW
ncbi:MAG: hypothetical protein WEB06_13345 [Actinomycetota bacterium]